MLRSPELVWIEPDSGHGAFAHEVSDVREVLYAEHLETIAAAWFRRPGAPPLSWVSDLVIEVSEQRVDEALTLIRALVCEAKTDEELAWVGAGPLEDILWSHGPSAIGAVEQAAQDDRFRFALAGVWPSQQHPDVWRRVALALGSQERY
jgi:hypothetical protein